MAVTYTQAQALNWAKKIYNQGGTAYQNPYGKQCMALAVHYCVTIAGFRPWGNAIAFVSMALPPGFKRIKNVASTRPQKGDLVVWAYGSYSVYGHVGIVTNPDPDGNLMTFTSMDQNWYNASLTVGSPPAYVKHNYDGVWGFIRPQFVTSSKAEQATNKSKQKVEKAQSQKVGSLETGKVPPMKYTWSSSRLFKAKADSAGVTINTRTGGKGNYSWHNTNMTYPSGTVFWVYEIMDGWCRIYDKSYNGWVWHERLRITSIDVKPSNKGAAKKPEPKKNTTKKDTSKETASKTSDAFKDLKVIKSKHMNGDPITWKNENGNIEPTPKKPKIEGVILHDDYGTMTPSEYEHWLYTREEDGTYVNGWASYYINRNELLYYNPDDRREWHAGNSHANSHLIGIERTETHPSANLTKQEFADNEEMSFALAAQILKKYKLPVNRTTVQLHRNWSTTSCPHKAWAVHINGNDTKANRTKLQDYFIKRVKHYYDGGKAPNKVEPPKDKAKKDNIPSIPTGYVKNSKGVLTKRETGRFIVGDSPIKVRTGASTKHKVTGILPAGYNGIIYDTAIIQNGYRWISYISNNGRRYMATGEADKNGNRTSSWGKFTTV